MKSNKSITNKITNSKPLYIEGDDLNADWIKKADPEAQKADIAAGEEARKMNDKNKTKEAGVGGQSFIEFVTGQAATTKHLGGKHDQDRHGLRAGGKATPEQLAARKRVAVNRAEAAKPTTNVSKPLKTDRSIVADKKTERQNEKKSAERLLQTVEKLRGINGPKNDDQFVKLDGIRDRIDRVNKHLGIDVIGTGHLRAANATESWNKLRPAITSTLSAMRARVNMGAYHNSGELKIINALIDDINAAIDKL